MAADLLISSRVASSQSDESSKREESAEPVKHTVLIVEDHPILRRGLRVLLNEQPDFRVVGESDTAPGGLALAGKLLPDLAIVDLTLNLGTGLELTKALKSLSPKTKILVHSMHDEAIYAERALRAGAAGYLMKNRAADELVSALRTMIAGGLHLSEAMQSRMLNTMTGRGEAAAAEVTKGLSDREMDVLALIGEGFSTPEIARRLLLSPKTIDSYRESLKQKLPLDETSLVRFAIEWSRHRASQSAGLS